jgi:AraC family transcriptional regulator of adaptative response/methylated-DNA-[protein]-cysteine methyltransferase
MLTQTATPAPDAHGRLTEQSQDYHRMAKALAWLAAHWRDRPTLDGAAAAAGLSPFHFQRVFTRWAGVSPKTFLAAIAHAEARGRLEAGATVLDAALDVGLSGPSRLHDLFVSVEAITPGEVRRRGQGVDIVYGFAPSPFGLSLVAQTNRGLCGLAFSRPDDEARTIQDMRDRWPAANWLRDDACATATAAAVFGQGGVAPPLVLMGPPFHLQVWRALLRIPAGFTASYSQVAAFAGRADAPRAVGAAIGANPISFLIPCHRAIAKDGRLTGYHWGLDRKAAMLGREAVERWGGDAA